MGRFRVCVCTDVSAAVLQLRHKQIAWLYAIVSQEIAPTALLQTHRYTHTHTHTHTHTSSPIQTHTHTNIWFSCSWNEWIEIYNLVKLIGQICFDQLTANRYVIIIEDAAFGFFPNRVSLRPMQIDFGRFWNDLFTWLIYPCNHLRTEYLTAKTDLSDI